MQAVLQAIVLQLALSGLVIALVAIPLCAALRRLRTQCRALNVWNCALAAFFLFIAVRVGGTKTNNVNNLPQQQLMMPRPTLQMLNTLPPAGGAVNLADPVQASRAAAFAADWNVCGAWKDSFWLPFADGWVFPWGTNHLSGVEVVSYGRLWPTPFDTNAVASAGAQSEIVPGLTSFAYELTPSNSYRFAWRNAAIGRDTNDLVSAVLELFRNGDRSVTTNGVTAYLPRELPFAHDGFGQDAEWVAANFTNATEIAAAGGYAAWVDAQVGEGLTNGLYKLTVTVPDDPPETTQITVGDLSVAVTNAGEYVFLLEKGIRYPIMSFPSELDNVAYSVADDEVQTSSEPLRMMAGPVNSPRYSVHLYSQVEQSEAELVVPSRNGEGYVLYYPQLHVIPDDEYDPVFPVVLGAYVLDIPPGRDASYAWSGDGFSETGPYVLWFGNEDTDVIEVQAAYGDIVLNGWVVVERHVRENDLIISSGGAIVTEDCYTNAPGEVVAASSTVDRLGISWALAESGTIRLDASCSNVVALTEDSGGVQMPVSLPREWVCGADDEGNHEFLAAVTNFSATGNVGAFTLTFTPDDPASSTLTRTADLQVVKVRVEALADWPSNKVRHVFGVNERFRIQAIPDGDLLVTNAMSTADVCDIEVLIRGSPRVFSIQTEEPSSVDFSWERTMTGDDWAEMGRYPLQECDGVPGVGFVATRKLNPSYVSFRDIFVMEGFAAMTNQTGCFTNELLYPPSIYSHDRTAGAFRPVEVTGAANAIEGVDLVGVQISPPQSTYGTFSLDIPVYWGVDFVSCSNMFSTVAQRIAADTNGWVRIEKGTVYEERNCLDGYANHN